jgi:hypothetical protein
MIAASPLTRLFGLNAYTLALPRHFKRGSMIKRDRLTPYDPMNAKARTQSSIMDASSEGGVYVDDA